MKITIWTLIGMFFFYLGCMIVSFIMLLYELITGKECKWISYQDEEGIDSVEK